MSLFPIVAPFFIPATVSFRESAVNGGNITVYTFSAVDLGASAAAHKVVVGLTAVASASPDSVTVDGINATSIIGASDEDGANDNRAEIWSAEGVEATSGDIVVTFSGGGSRCGIAALAVDKSRVAAHDTQTSITDPLNATIAVPAGGILIGIALANGNSTFAWTNMTEDFDEEVEAETHHTGASDAFSTDQAALSVTCTPSGSTLQAMALASWGPK